MDFDVLFSVLTELPGIIRRWLWSLAVFLLFSGSFICGQALLFSQSSSWAADDEHYIKRCTGSQECLEKLQVKGKHSLGAKYSYGSTGQDNRYDCSGLVLSLINSVIDSPKLPRTSQGMYTSLQNSVKLEEAQLGDLLFFNTGKGVSHVGMYWGKDEQGNHLMYHASSSHGVEKNTFLKDYYWSKRLVGIKRWQPFSEALKSPSPPPTLAREEEEDEIIVEEAPAIEDAPQIIPIMQVETEEVEVVIPEGEYYYEEYYYEEEYHNYGYEYDYDYEYYDGYY